MVDIALQGATTRADGLEVLHTIGHDLHSTWLFNPRTPNF